MAMMEDILSSGRENKQTLNNIHKTLLAGEKRENKAASAAILKDKKEAQAKKRLEADIKKEKKGTDLSVVVSLLEDIKACVCDCKCSGGDGGGNPLGNPLGMAGAALPFLGTVGATMLGNVLGNKLGKSLRDALGGTKKEQEPANNVVPGPKVAPAPAPTPAAATKPGVSGLTPTPEEMSWYEQNKPSKTSFDTPESWLASSPGLRNLPNILAAASVFFGNPAGAGVAGKGFGAANAIRPFTRVPAMAFQNGGPITVPGTGSGDTVPMMLPPGSFVLNRNASKFLRRQTGGMVPTMLEPGELVYLNENIKRFQEGGQVSSGPDKSPSSPVTAAQGAKKQTFNQGEIKSGDIKPGGYINFIGDGSGFTGELKFFDGSGKHVGSYGGISGVARTAGSTQEQRKNVSGAYNPLPDGSYPIENPMGPGSQAVGSFAAWVNNPGGNIGRRGQIFLHNDIGSNGTQGCVGVELGGARGPNANTKKFTEFYDQVSPKTISVNLMDSSGKKFAPGDVGSGGSGEQGDNSGGGSGSSGGSRGGGGNPFANMISGVLGGGLASLVATAIGQGVDLGMHQSILEATPALAGANMSVLQSMLGNLFNSAPASASTGNNQESSPSGQSGGNNTQSLASGGDAKDKAILDMIASVEAAQGDPYGGFNTSAGATEGRATDKTIGWLAKNANGAIGRYQHMPRFILNRAISAGFTADTKFTPEVQDKMTLDFLNKDTGGMYQKWKNGNVSDDAMADELSRIWRGLPHSSGGTYPDKYAGRNKAHMSRSEMMRQMQEIKKLQKGGIVGLQNGGMVSTMLEPGEMVFAPGTWDNSIKQLNSQVPRFQSGGQVSGRKDNYNNDLLRMADEKMMMMNTQQMMPQVITIPTPVGNTGGQAETTSNAPPYMPMGPSVNFLSDVINRTNMGSVFS